MSSGIETSGQMDFWTDRPVKNLSDLAVFVMSHATAPDIQPEELLRPRLISVEHIINSSYLPEVCEFTIADAHFLVGVISYVLDNPQERASLVVMVPDEDDPETTYVEVHFPAHMEPPAELR